MKFSPSGILFHSQQTVINIAHENLLEMQQCFRTGPDFFQFQENLYFSTQETCRQQRKTPTLSFPVDLQCSYMVRPLLSNLKVSCFCIISTFIFPRVSLERETEKAKLLFLLSFKYQMINRSVKNLVFLVPDADRT